jgi:outer membrane protein OmpU
VRRSIPYVVILACAGLGQGAAAAEVRPGGALDLTVSGFIRFHTAYGKLDKKPNLGRGVDDRGGDRPNNRAFKDLNNFDFFNDTEVHVIARGVHDATGLEYGGTIELEADTFSLQEDVGDDDSNFNLNSDETWIFVRGGFGELRFGDTDSAANTMKIGGYTIAVGTGGTDGLVVDQDQVVIIEFNRESEDATKAVYYSPVFGGFQFGVSYTPEDDSRGDTLSAGSSQDDTLTAGLAYTGAFGPVGVLASVVGIVDGREPLKTRGAYAGVALDIGPVALAAGAGARNADRQGASDVERVFYNVGAAYRFDRFAFSVNYGFADTDSPPGGDVQVAGNSRAFEGEGRISDLVFGAEVALLPGLVLSNEIAFFSVKRPNVQDDFGTDNDAWVGVARLSLTF